MHSLTIRFTDEPALVDWFQQARAAGLFDREAGVRRQDALDG